MSKASDMSDAVEEPVEQEVILSESEGGEPGGERRLWVYHPDDDFIITIPSEARVTFGYFNPAAAGDRNNTWGGRGGDTMKTTCLRVYADNTDKRQIAAFLGINGFRDLDNVKKVIRSRKVTIETNYEDDGQGNANYSSGRKQLPVQIDEEVF